MFHPHDDENIEQVDANSWDNEQVCCGDIRCVVAQKGEPSLRGRPTAFDHVLGDAGLSDLKSELEQFAMDARRAPPENFVRVDLVAESPTVSDR